MLSIIFKNPDLTAKRLNCSPATIYGWLNGSTPNLSTMMKVYKVYKIEVTLSYMYDFYTLIAQLLRMEELDELVEHIKNSRLDSDDKIFLRELFKAKYWKANNGK